MKLFMPSFGIQYFFVSQWFIFVPEKNPEVRARSFLIHPIQPRIKPNDKHLEQMMKITVH